jgi:hypothetical protein
MKKVWLIRQWNVEVSRDPQDVYMVLDSLKEANKILTAIKKKYKSSAPIKKKYKSSAPIDTEDIFGNKNSDYENWADENLYIEASVTPDKKDNKLEYMLKRIGYYEDYEDAEEQKREIEKEKKEAKLKHEKEVAKFKKQQKELEAYRQGKLKDPKMIEIYKKKDELLKRHI